MRRSLLNKTNKLCRGNVNEVKDRFLKAATRSVTSVNGVAIGFVTGLLERADRFLELTKTFFIAGG
jgi:hypothetical protein